MGLEKDVLSQVFGLRDKFPAKDRDRESKNRVFVPFHQGRERVLIALLGSFDKLVQLAPGLYLHEVEAEQPEPKEGERERNYPKTITIADR